MIRVEDGMLAKYCSTSQSATISTHPVPSLTVLRPLIAGHLVVFLELGVLAIRWQLQRFDNAAARR